MMIHLMSPCLDVINNFLIYLPYIFSVGNIKKKPPTNKINNISGDQEHNLKSFLFMKIVVIHLLLYHENLWNSFN